MTIYRPPTVDNEPSVSITRWSVRELPDGSHHIVGVIPESGHDGRVSSPIVERHGRVCTTRSGRKYTLTGKTAAISDNALYVWAIWCRHNDIEPHETKDVSASYLEPSRT